MEDDPRIALVNRLFAGTGRTYDSMVNLWTVGLDGWWKERILKKLPGAPERIMDQACGTGILTFRIAQRFPTCHVIGVELREEYLNIAKEKGRSMSSHRPEFILGRAEDVLCDLKLDAITSSYLAKYAEFERLIPNAWRMLRPGGVLIMHDFTYPSRRAAARMLEVYFYLMQGLGGRLYPQWRTIFEELPELLRRTRWVAALERSLREEGFSDIRSESLTLGISTIVSARKTSHPEVS